MYVVNKPLCWLVTLIFASYLSFLLLLNKADPVLSADGMFAKQPSAFARSGDIVQISRGHQFYQHRAPHLATNRGLAIKVFLLLAEAGFDRRCFAILLLHVIRQQDEFHVLNEGSIANLEELASIVPARASDKTWSDFSYSQKLIAVELESESRDDYVRWAPKKLTGANLPTTNEIKGRQICIRSLYTPRKLDQYIETFLIPAVPVLKRKFSISDQSLC